MVPPGAGPPVTTTSIRGRAQALGARSATHRFPVGHQLSREWYETPRSPPPASLVLLTGQAGTGKTTLTNALIDRLGEAAVVARLSYPTLEPSEFYQYLATAFTVQGALPTRASFLAQFSDFLSAAARNGRHVLLIIDDAQSLTRALLEEIRHLAHLAREAGLPLSILLVGQEELMALLQMRSRRPPDRPGGKPCSVPQVPERGEGGAAWISPSGRAGDRQRNGPRAAWRSKPAPGARTAGFPGARRNAPDRARDSTRGYAPEQPRQSRAERGQLPGAASSPGRQADGCARRGKGGLGAPAPGHPPGRPRFPGSGGSHRLALAGVRRPKAVAAAASNER